MAALTMMKKHALLIIFFIPLLSNAQTIIPPSSDHVVHFIQYSPDGKQAIANTADHIVGVWDMSTGKLLHSLVHEETAYDAIYDPSGNYILSYSYSMGMPPVYEGASLWDAGSGKLLYKFEDHNGSITTMDFSPDSKKIITGSRDSTVNMWNVSNGSLMHSLEKHNGTIECVKFNPDGNSFVTTSSDKTAIIWDSNTGDVLHTLQEHTGKVAYAEFSPDGKTLFTASSDNSVKIWNADTGEFLQTLKGHPGNVTYIAFSPDNSYLLTVASDMAVVNNTIMLWDARSLNLIHKIEGNIFDDSAIGHRKFISAAVFSSNGKRLITSSFDRTVKIWDTETGKLVKNFDYHAPNLAFHPSKNIFLAGALNGFLMIDAEAGDEIIELYTVDDAPEKWIHMVNLTYLDTQEELLSRIIVRENGQRSRFTNYKADYYVTGLWNKVMKGDTSFIKNDPSD